MKKSIALILTFVLILMCFAGCKKIGEADKVDAYKDFAGEAIPVVTKENGGIIRDDAGNVVVYATEKDGTIKKDENGEPKTEHQAIEHAIVTGNRIEMADYAINIPDGWSDLTSYADLQLTRDGYNDVIVISAMRDKKLADVEASNAEMFKLFPGGATTNKAITVAGEEANFISAFTTVQGTGVYLGFISFSHNGVVYNCRLGADRDISGDINEIVGILNTIEFVH